MSGTSIIAQIFVPLKEKALSKQIFRLLKGNQSIKPNVLSVDKKLLYQSIFLSA